MTHNTKKSQQVGLVTAAGSGIGRVIALSLTRAGHQLFASMRCGSRPVLMAYESFPSF